MNNKENLVLVHSFPTNSILLHGLKEFLDDYFNVVFIDLPGFTKKVPALETVTLDSYSDFVASEIKKQGLTSYLLAGISFGFAVVNNIKDVNGCKAILAIEPYLNNEYLHMGFVQKFLFSHLLDVLNKREDLVEKIWKHDYADDVLSFLSGQTLDRTQSILKEFESRTFFKTAELIIDNAEAVTFHPEIPYVLVINEEDETVDADKVCDYLKNALSEDNLLIINTTVEHYPADVSKAYFEEHIPGEEIQNISNWITSTAR